MCKQVQSKGQAVRACLCAGFVSAALVSALVLAGCGGGGNGNPGNEGKLKEYLLTINIDPADGDNGVNVKSDGSDTTVFIEKYNKYFKDGDTVTLTARPGYQKKLTGWSGTENDTAYSITFVMSGHKTIKASFRPSYILLVRKLPPEGGLVTKNPDKTEYAAGEQVTVTADDTQGYTFTGWSGASNSTSKTVTITVNRDDTLTANFESIYVHSLNVTKVPANGGTVNKVPDRVKYEDGESVTLTAVPAEADDYRFIGWSGASDATTKTITVKMDGDKDLTATFRTTYLTLTVKAEPASGGTVSYDKSKTKYADGDIVVVNAVKSYPYTFTGWWKNGEFASLNEQIIFTMDDHVVLIAKFQDCTANPYSEGCPAYNECLANPAPGCPNYVDPNQCVANPQSSPSCPGYNPCVANPNAEGCGGVNPCDTNPQSSSSCPGYNPCIANPQSSPSCPGYDPCVANPQSSPSCPGYNPCIADPNAAGCGGVNPCDDNPQIDPSCPGYNPCVANPQSSPSCPGYDPCVADPQSSPSCQGYSQCIADPQSSPLCPGYVAPTKWCYIAPASSNSYQGQCFQINGPNCSSAYCKTEEACTAPSNGGAGVPMTEDCRDLPLTGNPCVDNPSAQGCPGYCAANPTVPECSNDPCVISPTLPECAPNPPTGTYCYWPASDSDPASCQPIGGWHCNGPTCTEALCRAEYGVVITDCNNPPVTTYCFYGFDKCYQAPAGGCDAHSSTANSATCAGATGTYCDYGQPTQYSNGGCYFQPKVNVTPNGTAKCGTADGDLEYATAVTEAQCIASNTINSCIQVATNPGATGDNAPGCNPLKP